MTGFEVRLAEPADARAMAQLYAAVAAERDGIATEPPVDIREAAGRFAGTIDGTIVAVGGGQVIGMLHVDVSRFGFAEFGMCVDRSWRGRGVGSALVAAAVSWCRGRGVHKLCLEVFPHNAAAIAMYRKAGFVEEGRRVRHYRRVSGEFWDAIIMGLQL
jgi:RimJ/RimL family protein N-acetyltransferase